MILYPPGQIPREPWCEAGLLFKPNIIKYISEWLAWDIFRLVLRPSRLLLGNIHLNSLSWADDLVLMSTSKTGLQKCLDNLQTYCCKWGLEVNAGKTKTMTFSKRRVLLDEPLIFGDSPLKDVDAFNYLGFCIKHNNDTSGIINDRVLKARRVAHMLMQCLSINRHNISPLLSLKLFDKQIAPILHYGAVIWSVPKTNNYIYFNYNNGAETRNIVTGALSRGRGRTALPPNYGSTAVATRLPPKYNGSTAGKHASALILVELWLNSSSL